MTNKDRALRDKERLRKMQTLIDGTVDMRELTKEERAQGLRMLTARNDEMERDADILVSVYLGMPRLEIAKRYNVHWRAVEIIGDTIE